MLHSRILSNIQRIADKYNYLQVLYLTKEQFLEDPKGYYIGLVPIRTSQDGKSIIRNTGDHQLIVEEEYYLVWRLPEITVEIFEAVLIESSFVGNILSATSDIQSFHTEAYGPDYVPPAREFVAVRMSISIFIPVSKDRCLCLSNCV